MSTRLPRKIFLYRTLVALVDWCDYDRCVTRKWCATNNGWGNYYVTSYVTGSGRSGHRERLHRFVLAATKGQIVDHVNGNGLDNRRCNLRFCTPAQNTQNTRRKKSASGYRGVWKSGSRWRAVICVNRASIRLGYFATREAAALAYNAAAKHHHGEFATLNEVQS